MSKQFLFHYAVGNRAFGQDTDSNRLVILLFVAADGIYLKMESCVDASWKERWTGTI
jgi:hypothetical protein